MCPCPMSQGPAALLSSLPGGRLLISVESFVGQVVGVHRSPSESLRCLFYLVASISLFQRFRLQTMLYSTEKLPLRDQIFMYNEELPCCALLLFGSAGRYRKMLFSLLRMPCYPSSWCVARGGTTDPNSDSEQSRDRNVRKAHCITPHWTIVWSWYENVYIPNHWNRFNHNYQPLEAVLKYSD